MAARPRHSRLTREERRALPPGKFALPPDRYPIPDRYHAGLALGRARHASPRDAAKIRRNVHQAFPGTRVRGEFLDGGTGWTPWLIAGAAVAALYLVTHPRVIAS